MAEGMTYLRISLIVIVVIAVLIIINSSWNLYQLNNVSGDTCACSGLSDSDISGKRILEIIVLIVGILLLAFGIYMFWLSNEGSQDSQKYENGGYVRERFRRQNV